MYPTGDAEDSLSLPAETPDRALAVRVHDGDRAAALALIDRYSGPLFNLVHRTTGLPSVAVDVTRESLAAAVAGLAERVPPKDVRWIVLLAADAWRRLLAMGLRPERPTHRVRISPRHWEPEALHLSGQARPGPRRAAQKLRQRLWRAWSALPMRERFVLTLSDTHLLSVEELAEVLGERAAAARLHRDEAKLALMALLAARRTVWPPWLGRTRREGGP
jgi:DNA-directed RNA polymerase specialized sigma24 family protein